MNRLIAPAVRYGVLPEAPALNEQGFAPAPAIAIELLTWGIDLARTRLPQGYARPEHAIAIACALGLFYTVVAHTDEVDAEALLSARDAAVGSQEIDQVAETAAELSLYDDLMQRAADLALHGRNPGPQLVERLMRYSLLGILDMAEGTPAADALLARMQQCAAAIDAAIPTK